MGSNQCKAEISELREAHKLHPAFTLISPWVQFPNHCVGEEPKKKTEILLSEETETGVWSYHNDWDLRDKVLDGREFQRRSSKNLHKNLHWVFG